MKQARCPRCGEGKLYQGLLALRERCEKCGLPFHHQGDGPAFFAILLIGTLAGIFAAIVEIKFAPPYWLHAVLWIPFIIISSILCLRWVKTALLSVQYRTKPEDFTKTDN